MECEGIFACAKIYEEGQDWQGARVRTKDHPVKYPEATYAQEDWIG